jgi:predicted ATPase
VQEMIGLMLGEHEVPAAVRQQIVATTDGVPLFVEEVTKMILDRSDRGEAARDTARLERAPTLTIPATLHDLLAARLDRLGPAKGVAQLASTIGREFSYALLQVLPPGMRRHCSASCAAWSRQNCSTNGGFHRGRAISSNMPSSGTRRMTRS